MLENMVQEVNIIIFSWIIAWIYAIILVFRCRFRYRSWDITRDHLLETIRWLRNARKMYDKYVQRNKK